jgi:PBSX family phage terminase large subunit
VPEININIDYDSVFLPVFRPIVEPNDIDIELIWGGRDSGKSKFVAQLLTLDSLQQEYFRCLLIKETHNSVKDSQWQMIKDNGEQWGIDSLFKFNSSPVFIKAPNNKSFHARGMDDPAKIRSFTNPSVAWVEEANQISEDGFTNLVTGLRSDYGRVKLILTFNPEAKGDYEEFWLYKMFFAGKTEKNFTSEIKMKVMINGKEEEIKLKYRSTHATWRDNRYITPQRIAFHENLQNTDPYYYRIFTLGEWGNMQNDNPWLFTFSRPKHVAKAELFANKKDILFLTWDFNRNPQVCTILQWPGQSKVSFKEVIKIPKVGTEGICDIILQKYPGYLYMVTGDYAGETASSVFKEQVTNYSMIKTKLKLTEGQIKISPNPRLNNNRTLVNAIFLDYPVEMCPVKCKPLIYDCENVKMRADGTIVKDNRDDPAQQADVLDSARYWFNKFMPWYVKK